MKKISILFLVVVLVLTFNAVTLADNKFGKTARFNVKWEVEPMFRFYVNNGFDQVGWENGDGYIGDSRKLQDYVFPTKSPNTSDYYKEEWISGERIRADIYANDWWRLQFEKPALRSNNDHSETVDVYSKIEWARLQDDSSYHVGNWRTSGYNISKDMGVYRFFWDLKVNYENFNTRYGTYQSTSDYKVTAWMY